MWYMHAMKSYLALKENEILIRGTTWMNLEEDMLREISQHKNTNIA